jgi:putative endonuclease
MGKVGEKKNNQKTGAFGEQVTADYLTVRGDEILDRNWRVREGEIDLVSLSSDGIFHFIEVKTRLALAWLATHGCLGCEYAIDVVAILIAVDGTHTLEYRGAIL